MEFRQVWDDLSQKHSTSTTSGYCVVYIAAYMFNVYVGKGLHNSQGRRVLQFLFTSCGRPPQLSSRCCCVLLQTNWWMAVVLCDTQECRLSVTSNFGWINKLFRSNTIKTGHASLQTACPPPETVATWVPEKRLADDELPAALQQKGKKKKHSRHFRMRRQNRLRPLIAMWWLGTNIRVRLNGPTRNLEKRFYSSWIPNDWTTVRLGKLGNVFLKLEIELDRRAC